MEEKNLMSLKEWIVTLFICAIPFINLIMLFVWVFKKNTHPCKANFAKAYLILIGSFLVLGIILAIIGR